MKYIQNARVSQNVAFYKVFFKCTTFSTIMAHLTDFSQIRPTDKDQQHSGSVILGFWDHKRAKTDP